MARGRKPIPTAVQKRNGAYKINPSRENKNEPTAPDRPPTAPAWLDSQALIAWDHFSEILREMGLYSIADQAALCQLCIAWSNWKTATEIVQQHGMVVERDGAQGSTVTERSKFDLAARDWFDRFLKLLVEFGLTPSSRSRISVGKPSSVFNIVSRVRE